MVRACVFPGLILLCCAITKSAAGEHPYGLKVRIEPAEVTIRPFDPIFLRVVLKNESTAPVIGGREPTAWERSLAAELRKRGEHDYRNTWPLNRGGLDLAEAHEIFAPKGQRTTGVLIMETAKNLLFDRPGIYELRAHLRYSVEFQGASEPILVDVTETSGEQLRAAEAASKVIARGTLGGLPPDLGEKALLEAVEPLNDCGLKRTGLLLAAIAAVRDANTRDGFEEARKRIAELRKDCPEPMQDWISLTLANTLYGINQYELALEEIRRLPKDSFEREPKERIILDRLLPPEPTIQ